MADLDFAFVLGTRPEIIKLAPVIRECDRREVSYQVIHTGQHYSESLDGVFFEQLELPKPDYNLEVGSGNHGAQTGAMIGRIEELLLEHEPSVVLVQGDTNSVLAGAIATSKLDIELGHVEAGLRSFDREMPEELNRVLTDHAADYLFAPTDESAKLLRDEGLPDDRIFVTGNTIVDAVYDHRELAEEKSTVLDDLGFVGSRFILLTAHREENVDDPDRFASILNGVGRVAARENCPVVYPIHPRAEKRVDELDLVMPDGVRCVPPQDFLDFLTLERHADLVITDSGGVQEETCILGTPCVTIRESTERPETLAVGSNQLAGVDTTAIVEAATGMLATNESWTNPFGDGTAAEQILEIVARERMAVVQ